LIASGWRRSDGLAIPLRIDCDWYEPVHRVLVHLVPLVNEECPIILDDYYAWDGCARATHDYLSQNDLSWRVRSMDRFDGAWMIKRNTGTVLLFKSSTICAFSQGRLS